MQENNPTMDGVHFSASDDNVTDPELSLHIAAYCWALNVNSMHPSNVFIVQVLREIMIWFYVGKLVGLLWGGVNCRC